MAAQSIVPEPLQATSMGSHHFTKQADSDTLRFLLLLHCKHPELSHLRVLPAWSLFRTRRHLPLTLGIHLYTALSPQTFGKKPGSWTMHQGSQTRPS